METHIDFLLPAQHKTFANGKERQQDIIDLYLLRYSEKLWNKICVYLKDKVTSIVGVLSTLSKRNIKNRELCLGARVTHMSRFYIGL